MSSASRAALTRAVSAVLAAIKLGPAARQSRPVGAWETTRKSRLFRRLTLRRSDGEVYLDRWAVGHDRIGMVMLHRMSAPDPGIDLHDHPWTFVTIPLWGGYTEQRSLVRDAPSNARIAEAYPETCLRGHEEERLPFRPRRLRLDECHRVTHLRRRTCWTLVLRGPRCRTWGFYLADGYMAEPMYDATVRAERRDLWSDQNVARPW